jgi:hypothetical protein
MAGIGGGKGSWARGRKLHCTDLTRTRWARWTRGAAGVRIYSKERREGGGGPGVKDGRRGLVGVFFHEIWNGWVK